MSGFVPYIVGTAAIIAPFIALSAFFSLVMDVRETNRIDREIRREHKRNKEE